MSLILIASCAPTNEPASRIEVVRPGPQVSQDLTEYLERAATFGFSGAVLLAQGDSTLILDGFGRAVPDSSRTATSRTKFDIGSLSKQFTAVALLNLVAVGSLALHDSIGHYSAGVPQDKRGITVEHLLTHTSGLPREFGRDFEPMDRREFVTGVLAQPLAFPPGEGVLYSNAGYALAAAIGELIQGVPFDELMDRNVFGPAGIDGTGFYEDSTRLGPDVARPIGGPRDGESPYSWLRTWGNRGPGGVMTSVADLWTWERALRSSAALTPVQSEELFRPRPHGYALGWYVDHVPGEGSYAHHTGRWYGFSSAYLRHPADSLVIAVLSNRWSPWESPAGVVLERLRSVVVDGVAHSLPPRAMGRLLEHHRELSGVYVTSDRDTAWVSVEGDRLRVVSATQAVLARLAFEEEPAQERLRADSMNVLAHDLMVAVERGDYGLLSKVTSEGIASFYRPILSELVPRDAGVVVLGTIPTVSPDRPDRSTYVRIDRGAESEIIYFRWTSDFRIAGLETENPPLPGDIATLVSAGPTELVSYDLLSGVSSRIEVVEGHEASGLVIAGLRLDRASASTDANGGTA